MSICNFNQLAYIHHPPSLLCPRLMHIRGAIVGSYDLKQEVTDKYSLRGRVFSKIRADILSGKYKDHEELKEVAIGEELGVSRTPVREAFRQLELEGLIQIVPNKGAYVTGITAKDVPLPPLERVFFLTRRTYSWKSTSSLANCLLSQASYKMELEGLIQIVPNKGAYVTGITAKDVQDIYMIRSLLEGLCARWATEHITKEQLEELEENVYLADFHAAKGHLDQMAELDNHFHHILYEACIFSSISARFFAHCKFVVLNH